MLDSNVTEGSERIYNRDSFLDNIADKLGRERITSAVVRPKLKHQCHHQVMQDYSKDQLKEVLIAYTQNNLASQAIVTQKQHLSATLKEVCEQYCADEDGTICHGEVLLSADTRLLAIAPEAGIESEHYDVAVWDMQAGYQRNIALAEKAKVGVVFAEQALAESGTMVLYSNPTQGRAVSLLPEATVFIVPKSALEARLTQATAQLHQKAAKGERIPSCVNFISGPSSTADIELIKVVGVHGPVFATYIIVDDM